MKRILLIGLFLMAAAGAATAANGEFCASEKIDRDITGDWKGSDTYLLRIRHEEYGYTCVSIVEKGTKTVRIVRDLVVVNGELKHLTYYTPSTGSIVVYANIKFDKGTMFFDWYSSYDLKSGSDTYALQIPPTHKPEK